MLYYSALKNRGEYPLIWIQASLGKPFKAKHPKSQSLNTSLPKVYYSELEWEMRL